MSMTRKAFTLIELVVALGILAVILSFAGIVFRVSIDSHRMALANAEIMQNLRVITEQLDADFRGGAFRYPYVYPGFLTTNTITTTVGSQQRTVNSDGIAFFACGDFRSTGQYGGKMVTGNMACIYYGQPDPNSYDRPIEPREKVLLRRQTILAVEGPAADSDPRGEYFRTSPQEWLVGPPFADGTEWVKQPIIEPNDVEAHLPMYVAQGVDDFTIEYLDAAVDLQSAKIPWSRSTRQSSGSGISPTAFKFTFTLYDSKGLIKKGRTFTHIVVWSD